MNFRLYERWSKKLYGKNYVKLNEEERKSVHEKINPLGGGNKNGI